MKSCVYCVRYGVIKTFKDIWFNANEMGEITAVNPFNAVYFN